MEILSKEQVAQATAWRAKQGDPTWKGTAKHLGLPEGEWANVRDACEGRGDYAPLPEPQSKLDKLQQAAERMPAQQKDDIQAALDDRTLTEEEIDQLERIYHTGTVSFEDMAAALEPPVHWLTVEMAISSRGNRRPGDKRPTYSTWDEEGKARFEADARAGAFVVPQPL